MPHTNEVSKITNREIKAEALRRLKGNWGNCIALTVFILAFIFFLALCEAMLYLLLALFDAREYYFMSFMIRTRPGRFGIVFRLVLLFALIMPELYIARRLYIDIANGKSFVKSRRYIQSNFKKIFSRGLFTALATSLFRLLAAIPLIAGVYGAYYWGSACTYGESELFELIFLLLCLVFTIFWTGVFIYICISLCLANYIMVLNPEEKVFSACGMSVRLMKGKHCRYLSFIFSFVKFIPTLIMFYPLFILTPYYMVSYIVFIEDLMGGDWQDKLPDIIRSWNKSHQTGKES